MFDFSYDRNKALLEKSKYALVEVELKNKEQILAKQKNIHAQIRIQNEENKANNLRLRLEKERRFVHHL